MVVTLLGITVLLQTATSVFVAVSMTALQLSRESKHGFAEDTIIEVNVEQYEKALPSITVTEL